MNEKKSTPKGKVAAEKKAKPAPMKLAVEGGNEKGEINLTPVEETEIHNIHNAIVKRSLIYNGAIAKKNHCWFVFTVVRVKGEMFKNKRSGKMEALQRKEKRVGGIQVEKSFVAEHGDQNVINMIIVNILNKQKFFKD